MAISASVLWEVNSIIQGFTSQFCYMPIVFLPADITRFLKDYSTELSANYIITTRLLFNGVLITKNMIYMTTIIQDDVQNASHCAA